SLIVEIEAVAGPEMLAESLAVVGRERDDRTLAEPVGVEGVEEAGEQVVGVADVALVVDERALLLVALIGVGEERGVPAWRRERPVHLVGMDEHEERSRAPSRQPRARVRERLGGEAGRRGLLAAILPI